MSRSRHAAHVEQSRQEILGALEEDNDIVLVRAPAGAAGELNRAGARRLLSDRSHREIGLQELSEAGGGTALICGGGGFCQPHHALMPHVLAVAELRFERVILLPSTFDTDVDAVREAVERSTAVIFARERESFRRIRSLCDARLAHDTSFFFDYDSHRRGAGSGVLNAFRADPESAGERPIPTASDDLSNVHALEDWLATISRHAVVRTDRAQVTIAAALLGKEVEFDAGRDFTVQAIADYALGEYPVRRLPPADRPERPRARLAPFPSSPEGKAVRDRLRARAETDPAPSLPESGNRPPRVTAVVLSHNRPELVLGSLHSLIHATSIPLTIVVVDNNSTRATRRMLADACAEHPRIQVHLSDRNLGAAGGRKRALELSDTELVLFLDDDAELLPGALEHMVAELDRHPATGAVSATVVLPDGRVSHSGGSLSDSSEIVSFTLDGSGLRFDDPNLPASGRCDWLPWTALLVRTSLFERAPLDPAMFSYYEDNDWALRCVQAEPGSNCFRRSHEALVIHHAQERPWQREDFAGRAYLTRFILAAAYFYRRHRRLLGVPGTDVFSIMPELTRTNGTLDCAGARLVMALASTHSEDWLLMEWMNGGLDPVLGVERTALGDELHAARVEVDALRAELALRPDRTRRRSRSARAQPAVRASSS